MEEEGVEGLEGWEGRGEMGRGGGGRGEGEKYERVWEESWGMEESGESGEGG